MPLLASRVMWAADADTNVYLFGTPGGYPLKTRPFLLVFALCCCEMLGDDVRPRQLARTVYIVGMANELDQYLASRLTSGDVLRVVLDSTKADVVFTDKLDDTFWTWLAITFPISGKPSNTDLAIKNQVPSGKTDHGTVFLVDPRAKVVLWSTYDKVRFTSPDELDRAAARIAKHLKTSLYEK